jgi:hypothetical protein
VAAERPEDALDPDGGTPENAVDNRCGKFVEKLWSTGRGCGNGEDVGNPAVLHNLNPQGPNRFSWLREHRLVGREGRYPQIHTLYYQY